MKLIYRIVIRISLLLTLVLGVWAVFFYMAMMDEVNDEVDDSLEDYSEIIIIRALAGEELPSQNTGSNNQYYLKEVTEEYADSREGITYKDSMVYIVEKDETEPARILTTIFKDNENRFYELTVSIPSIEKEDLTIDAIASHLKMSRTKFYNKWKSVTGEAPTVFIEAVRMEKAHELLESGKYPVGTIPEMIGLKDVKNFRNRYKEYFGITPKESIKKK